MKIYKEKVIPESTKKVLSRILCDICKKDYMQQYSNSGYSIYDITVESKIGESYPEGGNSITLEFDICLECFGEKLLPLMKKEFGCEPRVVDSDW